MIDRAGVEQILAQYAKHGWKLQRVLLSPAFPEAEFAGVFDAVEITSSDLDGLWFARASRPGITAWELRHLSATPYALVENIPDGADPIDAEHTLRQAEMKMIAVFKDRRIGH